MTAKLDLLKVGDKIELLRIDSLQNKISYPSQVLDILDDDILVIRGPLHKNDFVFVSRKEKIRIIFVVKDKGKYQFDAEILNINYEGVYSLKIRRISDITKHQLRKYFRFEVSIPVKKYFTIIEDNEEKILEENCRTKDISGGGMKLYTNYQHNVGDIITCEFEVDKHLITTKAKVVRVEEVDTFEFDFALGVEFKDIEERNRDRIIKFIFTKQRELIEKGMI
ncbi:MAG: PilZ domain-containing protein [Tissierellales bacterium]